MRFIWIVGIIVMGFAVYSCENNNHKPAAKLSQQPVKPTAVALLVLPLGNMPKAILDQVFSSLHKVYANTRLLPAVDLPQLAYYPPRNRYRADSLIQWMGKMAKPHETYLGITTRDISTTKDDIPDWGIMGLGFQPGPACVVSTFRLHKNNVPEELFKVAIHEVGHTTGLPHCDVRSCFMRDAEGKNSTGEEKEFCARCKKYLISKGWVL